ncbi:MAG: hypothetical protein IPP91_11365 [Betaproteobacteria bacterium]|nr:hypothetical protein [Betaproteobacteria bacterium]
MSDLGGLNPHHAVAGFGGGLAYLPFMPPGGRLAALGSIVAGVTTAAFLTPVVVEALQRFATWQMSAKAELGLAFLLGLTAMITIPATLAAATWVRENIARLMERVTGVAPKPPDGGA